MLHLQAGNPMTNKPVQTIDVRNLTRRFADVVAGDQLHTRLASGYIAPESGYRIMKRPAAFS
jgi:hypothetical protein